MTDWTASRRAVIGAGVLLAGLGAGEAPAIAQTATPASGGTGPWDPAYEALDAWMNKPGTRHRMVFDATSPDGGEGAMDFANNFYFANNSGYGLEPAQIGVIVVLRHMATPFGYNDAIWAKYGAKFAAQFEWKGDKAKTAAKLNPRLNADPSDKWGKGLEWLGEGNVTALAAKGTSFAICALATQMIAMQLAKATGGVAGDIESELKAGIVPGGVLVPAGIVAVNRAQEHGYAFSYVG